MVHKTEDFLKNKTSTKPWQTAAWKKLRAEYIEGKVCSKCGSHENLVIHHLYNLPSYSGHFRAVADRMLKELIDSNVIQSTELKNGCPLCKYQSIYRRKKMKPVFKCIKCGHEFDIPIIVPTGRLTKEDYKKFLTDYKDKIEEIVDEQRNSFFEEEYMQFKDCIILCKKCHVLIHRGLDICPICGKNSKKINYPSCWECFQKTPEGKKRKKEYDEYKKFEEEENAFLEMADIAHELHAQGDSEGALRVEREFYKKFPNR
jgi:ribosomal protein L37AE/L43A